MNWCFLTLALLGSHVYRWQDLPAKPVPNGERRDVIDDSTATLDRLHCHITTLNPGERSSAPKLHEQEEVIVIQQGTIEATFDGHVSVGGPGSVIYFAAHAVTAMRNVGTTPATYVVINYHPRATR